MADKTKFHRQLLACKYINNKDYDKLNQQYENIIGMLVNMSHTWKNGHVNLLH